VRNVLIDLEDAWLGEVDGFESETNLGPVNPHFEKIARSGTPPCFALWSHPWSLIGALTTFLDSDECPSSLLEDP